MAFPITELYNKQLNTSINKFGHLQNSLNVAKYKAIN